MTTETRERWQTDLNGGLGSGPNRDPETLEAYIHRKFAWMPEKDREILLNRARWANEQYTAAVVELQTSRLTGDPLPPRNVRGPVDPDTELPVHINVPLAGDDLKVWLWRMAQMNFPEREQAIEWAKRTHESMLRPRTHHIALIESQLRKCAHAKELMPSFDDLGAQKYLEASLALWREGDAVD